MSTVNNDPRADKDGRGHLYEDADKLLRLAEELQEKCESYERRLWVIYAMGVTLTAMCLTGALYFTYFWARSNTELYPLAAGVGYLYAIAAGGYSYFMRAGINRRLARERRALHAIVDMLRDLEKGIAEKNNLSTLERAQFRIRLSRFDIGPGGM